MECFFARLVGKVDEGWEDKVCWLEEKSGTFSVGSLILTWGRGDLCRFHLVWCGMLGFHLRWASLLRRRFGEKLWLLISYNSEVGLWPINVFYALLTKSQLTISSYIVARWGCYGSFCSLFGISWVIHSAVKDTLLAWQGSFVRRKRKKIWGTTPLCLFWII